MINTIADLLQHFKEQEEAILETQGIKHPTTIGNMYEGLTRDILQKAIPSYLDLSVTNGFIYNDEGKISKQIDCMLVSGEGTAIPHTDSFKYNIHNVIAVIEVKKNLYASTLADSYANLLSVTNISTPKNLSMALFRDAFRTITRKTLPARSELNTLPFHIQMIYHALVVELSLPIRIVFGYNGFKTEESLRESFYEYLNAHLVQSGFGPTCLPNIVICESFSLLKLNGMPYAGNLQNDYWRLYASCRHNPLVLLLEIIWTRLSYLYKLPTEVFGEDLIIEGFNAFISAKCVQGEKVNGWIYNCEVIPENLLITGAPKKRWEPIYLDDIQFVIMNELCKKGEIDTLKADFITYLQKNNYTLDTFVKSLVDTDLVACEDGHLKLLTDECKCAVLPDGSLIAGEDKSGRLLRWMNKFVEEWRQNEK